MKEIQLYRTLRVDGGATISPIKPEEDIPYTEKIRLIADEGKMITKDGVKLYSCIDTDSADGWYEVDESEKQHE